MLWFGKAKEAREAERAARQEKRRANARAEGETILSSVKATLNSERKHIGKAPTGPSRKSALPKPRMNRRVEAAMQELPKTPLVEALLAAPMPLLDPDNKLIVLFSPKSACSSVAIWFFNAIGQLKAARDYDEWPHSYRIEVYNQSALRRRALSDPNLGNYRVVRVVRDPYDRVTSSFRHALATGYADKVLAAAISEFDATSRTLSFSRFLDVLETEDLVTCNTHHAQQVHRVEALLSPTHVINITSQNLFARLNEVEATLGMPDTDFPAIRWIHDLSDRRHVPKATFEGDVSQTALTKLQALNGPWPEAALLLTPATRERIASLYAADVAKYGNPPDAPLVRRAG